jgi:Cation transporter/ATPase, N-terminus
MNQQSAFWNLSSDQILQQMRSKAEGLSGQDAKQLLNEYGANSLKKNASSSLSKK